MSKKVLPMNIEEKPLKRVDEVGNAAKVVYKETIAYDENGEIVYDTVKKPRWQNGGGFVISYTEKMCEFLEKCSVCSTVRVFLYIAHHQQYGTGGIYGYRCSHKYLQQVLRLDRKSVYNALSSLKEQFLVNESRIDGQVEFMVNPNYVTIGSDKKSRMREWNLRWEMHWKHVHDKQAKTMAASTVDDDDDNDVDDTQADSDE